MKSGLIYWQTDEKGTRWPYWRTTLKYRGEAVMSEHVCEWKPDILGARCACGRALSKANLIERLNKCERPKKATERLSAEAERIRMTWYRVPLGGGDSTIRDLYHEMMSFVEAYADILEGK